MAPAPWTLETEGKAGEKVSESEFQAWDEGSHLEPRKPWIPGNPLGEGCRASADPQTSICWKGGSCCSCHLSSVPGTLIGFCLPRCLRHLLHHPQAQASSSGTCTRATQEPPNPVFSPLRLLEHGLQKSDLYISL